ncbi:MULTISPECIES: zinc metallopeptidase [unclassified Thioalkalivibrio]|uniref:zinc metallopeptidase n=1 Tax=unclassified Thioalkalivibrio TaxID=2621013 RepID=UPI0003820D23|nr:MULTISPECIES: zinc metallopeptidase [unclassified Thioalkalivibrio]
MRLLILLVPLLLLVAWAPGWWVRHTMKKYHRPADRYDGTGAELARELLDRHGLHKVQVETTKDGDHYDPASRTVRLSPENHDGHSLTAITVAAHEVGHAVQHAQGYAPLRMRSTLVGMTRYGQQIGAWLLIAIPFITLLARHPAPGILFFLAGVLSMGLAALVHFITLPTEFDASFRRAMPMLRDGNYLHPPDYPHAERILRAAAYTYLSQSLMSLLNIASWFRYLRR